MLPTRPTEHGPPPGTSEHLPRVVVEMRFLDLTDVVVVVVVVESSTAWDKRNMFVNKIAKTQRIELQFSNVIFIIFVLMILLNALSHRFVRLANTCVNSLVFLWCGLCRRPSLQVNIGKFSLVGPSAPSRMESLKSLRHLYDIAESMCTSNLFRADR